MITGTFITIDELQLRSQRPSICCCTPQACQQPCPGIRAESQRISQQLQLWETTVSSTPAPENLHDRHAGTSTTLSEDCNCGATVFSTVRPRLCRWHNNGHEDDQPRTALSNTLSMNESEVPSTVNRRGLLELVVHGQRCPVFIYRPGLAVYPSGGAHWV